MTIIWEPKPDKRELGELVVVFALALAFFILCAGGAWVYGSLHGF